MKDRRISRWVTLFLLLTFPGCGTMCENDSLLMEPPSASETPPPPPPRDPKAAADTTPPSAASPEAAAPAGVVNPHERPRAADGMQAAPARPTVPLQEAPCRAQTPRAASAGSDESALAGEEVQEQSEIEKILFTEYRKRRSAHFFFETSFDADACKEYIAFCEGSYRDFLKWAGLPADTDLWGTPAHVALIHNKAEWECLLMRRTQGMPPHIVEGIKNAGAQWNASPPAAILYSHEGMDPESDKLHLFHFLNHLFLHGLAGSGQDGQFSWLWEAFSWHRSIEVFGARGRTCLSFGPGHGGREDREWREWNDPDDWVDLLKRDVRAKSDEDFILFWHKDLMAIQPKTYVKAWAMIRWFTRDVEEKARFVDFLSLLLKTKNDQARALKEVYGASPDDIDKAWRKWIRSQPNRWRPPR